MSKLFSKKKKSSTTPQTPGSDTSTVTSGLTEGTSKGRTVITCAILLMESPSLSTTSSTPAGRKKFEVLQVSFTLDATIRSVLQNVKLQSSHNKDSLASTVVGLCRPGGTEFVNSFSIKKYDVGQNELLLGIPEGLTASQTARHSENMRKSSKLKALLQSMEIQKTIDSPSTPGTEKSGSPIATPLSPSYVVYAGPKKTEEKQEYVRQSVFVPTTPAKSADSEQDLTSTGSNLEVVKDTMYPSSTTSSSTLQDYFNKGVENVSSTPRRSVLVMLLAFALTTSFLNVLNGNRVNVVDLPGATLEPGGSIGHVSLFSKRTIEKPDKERIKLDVGINKPENIPRAAINGIKNVATSVSLFHTRLVPPPQPSVPSRPS